jgi:hypothetical protein
VPHAARLHLRADRLSGRFPMSLRYAQPRQADEVLMFHRPDRERPIPIDPDWVDFWENSGIFNTVCEDLGISADEFVRRLNDSPH